jgi:hypothetical protein
MPVVPVAPVLPVNPHQMMSHPLPHKKKLSLDAIMEILIVD